jgi:hypothetical protein
VTENANLAVDVGIPSASRPAASLRRSMDGAVAAQLWLAAGLLEVALRRQPLPRLTRAAGRMAASPAGRWFPAGRRLLTDTRLDELAARAGAAWRGPADCLPRSFLRCWLAASAGRGATLVVGVRRQTGTPFGAHAWVEIDGAVHAEDPDPTVAFHPIASYPLRLTGGRTP